MPTVNPGQARELRGKIDYASILGVLLAVVSLVGGFLLEGGRLAEVAQLTAVLIVFGGTLGAVLLNTPIELLLRTVRRLPEVFFHSPEQFGETTDQIARLALKSRREGLISLEDDLGKLEDPFLRRAVALAVDGAGLQEYRAELEVDIEMEERRANAEAHVLESAGGYSPTFGILGAVLGLMQVMKVIGNIDEVGRGIAVAFVATVYGVGAANLLFLPAAGKLRARSQSRIHAHEMIIEGVAGILEGMNPNMIRRKLSSFQHSGAAAIPARPIPQPVRVNSSQG